MRKYFKARNTFYINGDLNRLCFKKGSVYNGVYRENDNAYYFNDETKPNINYHKIDIEFLRENFMPFGTLKFGH